MLRPLNKTDPLLRKVCSDVPIKELRTTQFQETVEELLDFVYQRNNKGEKRNRRLPSTIGLSANQVGILKKISVVDFAVRRGGYSDLHVFINPEIIWHSKQVTLRREGCVNLPKIWGMIPRFAAVSVSALDRWGNEYTIKARGWEAILLQHEIDHLHGHLFIDRLPEPTKAHLVRDDQMKEYKSGYKTWSAFIDVTNLRKPVGD